MPSYCHDSLLTGRFTLEKLDTPQTVLFEAVLSANIRAMQERADNAGSELWPHVKSHKSLEIARRQLDAGATGLTAAKPGEAIIFLNAGLGPVVVAYPLSSERRIACLIEAAQDSNLPGLPLRCITDSIATTHALAQAAERAGVQLPVDIKVDVGLRRCGVLPGSAQLSELAGFIRSRPSLLLHGVLSHAGHAYAAASEDEAAEIAHAERRIMLSAKALVQADADKPLRVSVGCTPTVLAARTPGGFAGVDELRPGNYVFLDRNALRMGLATENELALRVLCSVVSVNDEHVIIDAGSKTLGMEKAPHGFDGGDQTGFGIARLLDEPESEGVPVARLSEEHGFLLREDLKAAGMTLSVTDKVLVTPNHSCTVANLARRYAVVRPGGPTFFWRVDASGIVR